jgi:hypothetical protein
MTRLYSDQFFIHSGCRLASPRLWKGRREAVFLFGAGHFANVGLWSIASFRDRAEEKSPGEVRRG